MDKKKIIISASLLAIGFLLWFDSSFQTVPVVSSSESFIQNLAITLDFTVSSIMIITGAIILTLERRLTQTYYEIFSITSCNN